MQPSSWFWISSSCPRQRERSEYRSIQLSIVNLINPINSCRASKLPFCASRTELIAITSLVRLSSLPDGGDKHVHLVAVFFEYTFDFGMIFILKPVLSVSYRSPPSLIFPVQGTGEPIPVDSAKFSSKILSDEAITSGRMCPYP